MRTFRDHASSCRRSGGRRRTDTRTDGSQKPQRATHLPAPWPPHLRNARNAAAYFIIWSCGMPASAHVFKSRARKFIGMLISPPRPGPARPAVRGLSKYVVSRRAREEAVVFNLLPPPRRFKVTKIKKKKKKKTSTLTQCTGSSVVTAVRCSAGKYRCARGALFKAQTVSLGRPFDLHSCPCLSHRWLHLGKVLYTVAKKNK